MMVRPLALPHSGANTTKLLPATSHYCEFHDEAAENGKIHHCEKKSFNGTAFISKSPPVNVDSSIRAVRK